uniref:Uncharacterized protein n=1 Tax=Alexandrium catenella TaxID=2925 RepID=A0A7S1R9X2_ALECA|mmetsp:Transcript_49132/g.131508  ORF Transcript_49132/g.131508 Transcript_49132/m.131508 type:complete len:330 (+) Transcript_49132:93-1082(+)
MAALRVLLFAGLCSTAAASAGDIESLVQREVGLHVPTSSDDQPTKILESISPQARRQMQGLMKNLLDDVVRFLQAAQAPMSALLGEPVAKYAGLSPEKLSELTTGYILAFNNTKFETAIALTAVQLRNAVGELGAKMGGIGVDLTNHLNGVVREKDAKGLIQLSVQQMGQAMTTAVGHFFNAMATLLRKLPTEYMRNNTKELKSMVANHTSGEMNDFFKLQMLPYIAKLFESGDLCDDVQDDLDHCSRAFGGVSDSAGGAVSKINATLSALEPHLTEIDPDLVPKVLASVSHSLEEFGSSLGTMSLGWEMYRKALLKVLEEKLSCPKQE